MGIISSTLIAFSMSTDAFVVSLAKGATIKHPKFQEALNIGIIFGTVEALTPLMGWITGVLASNFIKQIDHWVAFFILATIGVKYIYESFSEKNTDVPTHSKSVWVFILLAFATSIDAFAVGISLAFVNYNIIISALSIGFATFLMVTAGIMIGNKIGKKVGLYAERLGGVVLILIGTTILFEHLNII